MIYNIIIQVIAGLFFVTILALIAYSIFDQEYYNALTKYNTVRKKVNIINGIYDFRNGERTFTTQNVFEKNYINLSPSVNQSGGAEYTYNFWLYVDSSQTPFDTDYKALILKGSKQKVIYDGEKSGNCLIKNNKKYVFIKNPLIRISKDLSKLLIEYNTITNVDALNYDGSMRNNCNSKDLRDSNMIGIYDLNKANIEKKFTMITLVIKETSSTEDILYRNTTNCKLYLNSVLVLDREVNSPYNNDATSGSTVMKQNNGKFYINPIGIYENTIKSNNVTVTTYDEVTKSDAIKMANLSYYNYAIELLDIQKLYSEKFNTNEVTFNMNSKSYNVGTKILPDFESPKSY